MTQLFRLICLSLMAGLIALMPLSLFASNDNIYSNSVITTQQLGKMPLAFTENVGQWDEAVRFRANAGGATMWFAPDGAYYQFTRIISEDAIGPVDQAGPVDPANLLNDHMDREPEEYETIMIKANFVGANLGAIINGTGALEYKCNYFIGNDPNEWQTDVPNYSAVVYEQVYDGIDLKYYGNGRQMEYDFIVEPGADFSQIRIEYEGAESVTVNADGELVVKTAWGEVVEQRPVIYQIENGSRMAVVGKYSLLGSSAFGFELESYNPALPLVIDPVLSYSTYLGGSGNDFGRSIAVDASGSAYVTGYTTSADFPTLDPYQTYQPDNDVFVTKLSSSGNSLLYSTYLGGDSDDYSRGIAVDASGSAYVTGFTYSTDFPTLDPYQTDQDTLDVFVTKLSSSGSSLLYSTYLGGSGRDFGYGIAVDASGSAYVTGYTYSTDFPTLNPYQTDQGDVDLFVTKLSSSGSSLLYSTYLGGNDIDLGYNIAVDESGAAYVTGRTYSTNFPTLNPFQTDPDGNVSDAFVTKLSSTGSSLLYSTYLGGNSSDVGFSIAVDGSGSAYVGGSTGSTDFPTLNPYQYDQGDVDLFITKLSSSGSSLLYSTYLGGNAYEFCYDIAVDGSGCAYVTGSTHSTDFPTLNSYQADQISTDMFVTKLSSAGSSLLYSTYFGGNKSDFGFAIAVDASGIAYVAGYTYSSDFPIYNQYQIDPAAIDLFVIKIGEGTDSDGDWYADDIDCDPYDPNTFPGAAPNDNLLACMRDVDQDGYGDINAAGDITAGTDCNDSDESVYPSALELCDGQINDCNTGSLPVSESDEDTDGYVECSLDADGWDGVGSVVGGDDCDDTDPGKYPGNVEIPDDGIDQDCDGHDYVTPCCGKFTSGFTGNCDCDTGGLRDLADITRLVDHIYISKEALDCAGNGNVNGDESGLINLADITRLIDHVYITKGPTAICVYEGSDPTGAVLDHSPCKSMKVAIDTTNDQSCIEWQYNGNSVLWITHINAGFNCCPVILADINIENQTIFITEIDSLDHGGCDCDCLFDVEYQIINLPPGEYRVVFEEPYRVLADPPYLMEDDPPLDIIIDLIAEPAGVHCVTRLYGPWGN